MRLYPTIEFKLLRIGDGNGGWIRKEAVPHLLNELHPLGCREGQHLTNQRTCHD